MVRVRCGGVRVRVRVRVKLCILMFGEQLLAPTVKLTHP